jgi:hypothetical protein
VEAVPISGLDCELADFITQPSGVPLTNRRTLRTITSARMYALRSEDHVFPTELRRNQLHESSL